MLDVHPPHEAVHTWRDFFIHIATIVIGLLIAIGLEQTVEALRHRHERRQLQADLIIEARNNLELMKLDVKYFDRLDPIVGALRKDAATYLAHPGSAPHPVVLAQAIDGRGTLFPDAPVWNTARADGTIGLLPRSQAALYDLVYGQQLVMEGSYRVHDDAISQLLNFAFRFTADPKSPIDLARLSPADRAEYIRLLGNLQGALTRFRYLTSLALQITEQAANGDTDDRKAFEKIGVTARH